MRKYNLLILLLVCLFCVGCAQNISPNNYNADEVGTASHVVKATVVSERPVKIDNQSGVGGVAGATSGAVAGSAIAGGNVRGNIVGAVGGAVVGGVVGTVIDKSIHKEQGKEYILRLKNKSLVSVVQIDALSLHVGQHVLIIYGGMTRVIPDNHA